MESEVVAPLSLPLPDPLPLPDAGCGAGALKAPVGDKENPCGAAVADLVVVEVVAADVLVGAGKMLPMASPAGSGSSGRTFVSRFPKTCIAAAVIVPARLVLSEPYNWPALAGAKSGCADRQAKVRRVERRREVARRNAAVFPHDHAAGARRDAQAAESHRRIIAGAFGIPTHARGVTAEIENRRWHPAAGSAARRAAARLKRRRDARWRLEQVGHRGEHRVGQRLRLTGPPNRSPTRRAPPGRSAWPRRGRRRSGFAGNRFRRRSARLRRLSPRRPGCLAPARRRRHGRLPRGLGRRLGGGKVGPGAGIRLRRTTGWRRRSSTPRPAGNSRRPDRRHAARRRSSPIPRRRSRRRPKAAGRRKTARRRATQTCPSFRRRPGAIEHGLRRADRPGSSCPPRPERSCRR